MLLSCDFDSDNQPLFCALNIIIILLKYNRYSESSSVVLTFIKINSSKYTVIENYMEIMVLVLTIMMSVDIITIISFVYIFKLICIFINHKKLWILNKFIMLEFNIYGTVILC